MNKNKTAAGWAVPFLGALSLLGNLAAPAAGREPTNVRSVKVTNFGKTPDGTPVELYSLEAANSSSK